MISEELAALYAEDDRLRAEFEAWQARQPQVKTRSQPELIRRDGGFGVQRGREIQQATQQQQPANTSDDAWNEWYSKSFNSHIEPFADMFVDAVAEFVSEYVTKRLEEERAKLREEIAVLRQFSPEDMRTLRRVLDGEVVVISTLQGQQESDKILERPRKRANGRDR